MVEEVHCQAWCNTASASISSNLASSGCIQPIKQEKASGLKGGLGGLTKMTVSFVFCKFCILLRNMVGKHGEEDDSGF